MKKFFTLCIFCISTLSISAQPGFNKRYGSNYLDRSEKVIQTSDGNFLVVGETMSFGSASNALIMKVNPSGDVLWIKDYSGINSDKIYDVIELDDHSLVMCGATGSYGAGELDAFLMKTDENGVIQWAKSYGDIFSEYFTALSEDGAGGFYLAGPIDLINEENIPIQGAMVCRMSNVGEVIWTKTVTDGLPYPDPQLVPIASGGVILGWNFGTNVKFSLYKFSSSGDAVWSKTYLPTPGGSGLGELDILETDNGDILAITSLANVNTVAQQSDFFIIRLNSSGNFLWDKSYGNTYIDHATSAIIAHDGSIVVSGYTNSAGNGSYDNFIAKISDNGTFQWAQAYGTAWDDRAKGIFETAQNGFIFTGTTYSVGSNTDSLKVYLVSTDALGNTACNNVNFNLISANHTFAVSQPSAPSTFIFPKNEVITWGLNNRYFYTADICQPVSVEELQDLSYNLYPNPFSNETVLHADQSLDNATITIYNSIGEKVRQQENINGTEIIIPKENLPAGIYFMHLTQQGTTMLKAKLVAID